MQTSGFRSAVPPNHAATKPDGVSAIVEAWQEGNGADAKINSVCTMAASAARNERGIAAGTISSAVKYAEQENFMGFQR